MNIREKNLLATKAARATAARRHCGAEQREAQEARKNRPLQRAATQRAETQPPPAPEARADSREAASHRINRDDERSAARRPYFAHLRLLLREVSAHGGGGLACAARPAMAQNECRALVRPAARAMAARGSGALLAPAAGDRAPALPSVRHEAGRADANHAATGARCRHR